jgi:hypothetical protein
VNDPVIDLTPYLELDDEPTLEVALSKSDAIWASQEQQRAGNVEAAGEWLLVAGSL